MFLSGVNGFPEGKLRKAAHVIVCGNEKGGSGKSTTAMHIAIALLKSGHSVATVDLDGRQLSLTRYVENRRRWARTTRTAIAIPHHFHVPPVKRERVIDGEDEEFRQLRDGLEEIENTHDFLVIDTPGSDTYLSRLAHRLADTLVTPMNDSFVDFDVLARIDPVSHEVLGLSQYASSVRHARRQRRQIDNFILDWVVVRNRMAATPSPNEKKIDACLRNLAMQLGFRTAEGISDRMVFREFFPYGLTALDDFEVHAQGGRPTPSHLAARQEIRQLITSLRLPLDDAGRRRAEARRAYAETVNRPIAMPDIFAN